VYVLVKNKRSKISCKCTFKLHGEQGSIHWKIPSLQVGISANVIEGENMKRGKRKGGKCKRKRKKGERNKGGKKKRNWELNL
jgi:hypothetical protein